MSLVVYNTMERRKMPVVPRDEGQISIYSCGITPYDSTHLGHARQYVLWDIFRRYLVWKGYQVTYIQNFTDVDDKIIAKANRESIGIQDVAGRYIDEYFDVMAALGVTPADAYPKVTEHISEVIELVGALVTKGVAYEVDGDVYFDVTAMPTYGRLSGRCSDEMEAGARVDIDDRKRNPMDFAVWKSAKPDEPAWSSPWGPGRPGWHIECSAMALKYLGSGFDMHGGGMDLIFPHHENEIAQAEGATGLPFATYWMHHGFINVNAEKMSKSLGNFRSVKDLLGVYDAQTVRLFLISTQYRSPISFSDDEMLMCRRGKERLVNGYQKLLAMATASSVLQEDACAPAAYAESEALQAAATRAHSRFVEAMDDDFNTALAVACLYELVREVNRLASSEALRAGCMVPAAPQTLAILEELMGILGLSGAPSAPAADGSGSPSDMEQRALVDGLMALLVEVRSEARVAKNWAASDRIRDGLKALGMAVDDTPEGARWRRIDA